MRHLPAKMSGHSCAGEPRTSFRADCLQIGALLLLLSASPLRAEKIRILPAGDSNTFGVGNPMSTDGAIVVGYRKKLKELLAAQGIEIDYVGKVRSGYNAFDDPENEGYPGQGIEKIASRVSGGMLDEFKPDIVLLLIGPNNMWVSLGNRTSISDEKARYWVDELGKVLDEMLRRRPSMYVIVAKPATPGNTPAPRKIFREGIDRLVEERQARGEKIRSVDFEGTDNDGTHYTPRGHEQCAERWSNAIMAILGRDQLKALKAAMSRRNTRAAWKLACQLAGSPDAGARAAAEAAKKELTAAGLAESRRLLAGKPTAGQLADFLSFWRGLDGLDELRARADAMCAAELDAILQSQPPAVAALRAFLKKWEGAVSIERAVSALDKLAAEDFAKGKAGNSMARAGWLRQFIRKWEPAPTASQARREYETLAESELTAAMGEPDPRKRANRITQVYTSFPGTPAAEKARAELEKMGARVPGGTKKREQDKD